MTSPEFSWKSWLNDSLGCVWCLRPSWGCVCTWNPADASLRTWADFWSAAAPATGNSWISHHGGKVQWAGCKCPARGNVQKSFTMTLQHNHFIYIYILYIYYIYIYYIYIYIIITWMCLLPACQGFPSWIATYFQVLLWKRSTANVGRS